MKKGSIIEIICGFALVLFATATAAEHMLKGRVTDDTNRGLPGANVTLPEIGRGVIADRNGDFVLANVPEGQHKIRISYLGFQTHEQVLDMSHASGRLIVKMKPGVLHADDVVVIGERLQGQAKSLNQQQHNLHITNIISSDQVGRFPDANIGDAMKRITAITVNYDQGEARYVNIRGTEPRFNSIMINGERLPSAEAETRAVQVDLIPSDMVQSIEVSKALTPDMDADAIGGSVNLVTRSAPNTMRLSGSLGSGYNFLSGKPIHTGSAVIGKRFLNNKLGVVVSGSLHNHHMGSDNAEGVWAKSEAGGYYVEEWDIREYDITRFRRSVAGSLDFILNDQNTVYLNTIYNHRDDWENRYRARLILSEPDAAGVSTSTEIRRQIKGGLDSDRGKMARLEDQRTSSIGLSGKHLIGAAAIAWSASYAKASEERPNERYLEFRAKKVAVQTDLGDTRTPYFTPVQEAAVALDKFSLKELTEQYQWQEEKNSSVKFDLDWPLIKSGIHRNSLKIGGTYKNKDKERDNNFYEYSPTSDALKNLSVVPHDDMTNENFLAGEYKAGFFPTRDFLGGLNLKDPAQFKESDVPEEYAAANFNASEQIKAGYAMLTQHFGEKWIVVAGVRVENTIVDYQGHEYNDDTNSITPTSGDDQYADVLPGLHVKFSLTPSTILRAAWTNTLARPDYYYLVPYRNILVEDNELSAGNPGLKPTRSMNMDLMMEKYLPSVGVLSAGAFYKDIKDFIYINTQRDYFDKSSSHIYDKFYQPLNGANATLYGFELAFQRRLDMLPGFLRFLNIYGNYTYTHSRAENPALADDTIKLPGTADHTLNASATFETSRLILGASFNYTSAYLDPYETDLTPMLERYYDRVTYLDFNASYKFMRTMRLYAEVNNLLNQPMRYYAGDPDRTYQMEYYNRRVNAGIKFDL